MKDKKYEVIKTKEEYDELRENLLSSLDDSERKKYEDAKKNLRFYDETISGTPVYGASGRITALTKLSAKEEVIAKEQQQHYLKIVQDIEKEIGLDFIAKSYCNTQAQKLGVRLRGL